MKRILLTLVLLATLGATVCAQEVATPARPTIGIALGGGGAKGAAHIGVLRYFEEIGLPIDYIAGTSIGSIIGGFYALGYSPDELDTLISGMDWSWYMSNVSERRHLPLSGRRAKDTYLMSIPFNTGSFSQNMSNVFLSSLPSGFISGNRITNLFNNLSIGYLDSIDFRDLPIPFVCTATDIITGDSMVFRSGNLPLAIRSSMAIPGVFSPVHYGKKVLCDGGFVANLPVEICRNMGADIVIGIDISDSLVTDNRQLKSLPQLLNQFTGIAMKTDVPRLKPLCDLYMHPNITGYSTLSFNKEAIDTLIQRGYQVAKAHHDELMAIKQQVDPQGTYTKQLHAPKAKSFNDTIIINNIHYYGIPKDRERWLRIKDGIYEEQHITRQQLEEAFNLIEGSGYYTNIIYTIDIVDSSAHFNRCDLHVHVQQAEPHNFSLGLRVDSEESAAVLLHLGFNQYRTSGFQMEVDGRINHNPSIAVATSFSTKMRHGILLDYKFHNSHFNLGNNYSREYTNLTVGHHSVQLALTSSYGINSSAQYGVEQDVYVLDSNQHLSEFVFGDIAEIFTSPGHVGPYVTIAVDNFNDGYFPTSGHGITLAAHWRLANTSVYNAFAHDTSYYGFGDIMFNYQQVIPLGKRACLIPQTFNRILIGSHSSLYDNLVGGVLLGRYMEQQLPFIGFNTPQRTGDLAHVLRLDLRLNVAGNHYLTFMGNALLTADNPASYFSNNGHYHEIYGAGIRYSYKLGIGGPISVDLHWSTLTHRLGFFFNFGCTF